MPISEMKTKIAIDNYFKVECDINTSIREAFEKGFRIGVQKGYETVKLTEITLESAIDYLQNTGWLQEHDRILTESVKPEREKGEWIYDGKRGRFPACKCSICGHYENADWVLLQGINYCPHCGADMRGGDERDIDDSR